ncbi:hypothetical protein Btru_051485 [Bulinus truncatus]|nr:hypothetical protein Btru_051485 [Bulinus truncatus]
MQHTGDVTPAMLHMHHQDGVFQNSFQTRSNYVIHPQWVSEARSTRKPEPLLRCPWPWEQPRFKIDQQAVQITENSNSFKRYGIEQTKEQSEQQHHHHQLVASQSYAVRNPLLNNNI